MRRDFLKLCGLAGLGLAVPFRSREARQYLAFDDDIAVFDQNLGDALPVLVGPGERLLARHERPGDAHGIGETFPVRALDRDRHARRGFTPILRAGGTRHHHEGKDHSCHA